jgi:hypothetical protein
VLNSTFLTPSPASPQAMSKKTLAAVALLTESEAAKMFEMGTTRFKARYVRARLSRPRPLGRSDRDRQLLSC